MPIILGSKPAIDLYETDNELVAEANIPDFNPDDISISIENDNLIISGESKEENEEERKGYYKKEIRRGSFERMVRLPMPVDEDKINATYEKGILKVIMPKAEEKREGKKIKIKSK